MADIQLASYLTKSAPISIHPDSLQAYFFTVASFFWFWCVTSAALLVAEALTALRSEAVFVLSIFLVAFWALLALFYHLEIYHSCKISASRSFVIICSGV
jgi:hypothetical protein